MKMSEILERAKALRKMQSDRETAAIMLDAGESAGLLSICDEDGNYLEFVKGTATYDALVALVRGHQEDVESRMRALGVEIDMPAVEADDELEAEA